jgi:phospholipid N-methyltransferase
MASQRRELLLTGAGLAGGYAARLWIESSASMTAAALRHPKQVGEAVPTMRHTCRVMAAKATRDALPGCLVELGSGNGRRSTQALLEAAGERSVILTELDPVLRRALIRRHWGDPRVKAILADAQDVSRLFSGQGLGTVFDNHQNLIKGPYNQLVGQSPAAWYCFLPFLSLPMDVSTNVLAMVRRLGGRITLIQYTSRREAELVEAFGDNFTRQRVWRNLLPPAYVYTFFLS